MENKFEVGDLVKVADEGKQFAGYKSFYDENSISKGNFVEFQLIKAFKDYKNIIFTVKALGKHCQGWSILYVIGNKELKLEFIFGEEGLKLFGKMISKEKQLARDLRKFCKREGLQMKKLKLLEAFAGIGAWRKAFERVNISFESVGYFEKDKYASESYKLIYDDSNNLGDITIEQEYPDHDIFCYSPPCQSFSIAGKRVGLQDIRGQLFFYAAKIIEAKQPKYALMENVKGLLSDNKGKTIKLMIDILDNLGYNNYMQVLNAKDYGIPQNRERVFIISIRKDIDDYRFEFPKKQKLNLFLYDLLESSVDEKYYLSDKTLNYIKTTKFRSDRNIIQNKNISDGLKETEFKAIDELHQIGFIGKNSDETRVYDNNISRTLKSEGGSWGAKTGLYIENSIPKSDVSYCIDANYYKGGSIKDFKEKKRRQLVEDQVYSYPLKFTKRNQKNLPSDYNMCIDTCNTSSVLQNRRIRRLTPLECFRLMGFDDEDFNKLDKLSDTQKYKMAGNSIVVNVIEEIFKKLFINKKPIGIHTIGGIN